MYIKNSSSLIINKFDTTYKTIILTFDCGGNNKDPTSKILNVLKKYNIKANFFLTGEWVEKYPLLAKRIANEHHPIGNHSFNHPDLTKLTTNELIEEINNAENIIKKTTGMDPKPLFRPPYGLSNKKILTALGLMGYSYTIYWTIDPKDWEIPPAYIIINRVLDNIQNGAIILLHNHSENTAKACDIFIPKLKKQGFKFTTLDNAISDMYKNDNICKIIH